MTDRSAPASVVSQVLLGLAAHVTAGGCLPELPVLAVVLPVSWLAVTAAGRGFRKLGPFARLLAGQAAVHTVLGLAARGGSHGQAASVVGDAAGAHVATAGAHLLATALCLWLVGRCEAAIQSALSRANRLAVGALLRRVARPGPACASPAPGSQWPLLPWPAATTALSVDRAAQRGLRGPPGIRAPAPA